MEGSYAARYFPHEVIGLANTRFLITEVPENANLMRNSLDTEPNFGITGRGTDSDFFPPSAYRGVFLPLLRQHPHNAIKFIIDLLNHSASWYSQQLWPYDKLEGVDEVEIKIPGSVILTQWGNHRLWNLYRGHTVGPYLLQCTLMALEAWLLEICTSENVDIEQWLLKILRNSNSVMATAVVCSVCNAYPCLLYTSRSPRDS